MGSSEIWAGIFGLFVVQTPRIVRKVPRQSRHYPELDSKLPYFSGKARLEEALKRLGTPYTIRRPAVLFGGVDILINNMAWALRRLPVFGVFGNGSYGLRPIHVADLANLAVDCGQQSGNAVVDAVGPESYTYRELVVTLGEIIGCRRPIVSVPAWLGYWAARLIEWWHSDVFLTREEIAGITSGLLESTAPSTGRIHLSEWAKEHARELGQTYASELWRRRERGLSY